MCDNCTKLQKQIDDINKQLETALPVLYATFEHVQAMTSQQAGIHSRWQRHVALLWSQYVDRKRAITESDNGSK